MEIRYILELSMWTCSSPTFKLSSVLSDQSPTSKGRGDVIGICKCHDGILLHSYAFPQPEWSDAPNWGLRANHHRWIVHPRPSNLLDVLLSNMASVRQPMENNDAEVRDFYKASAFCLRLMADSNFDQSSFQPRNCNSASCLPWSPSTPWPTLALMTPSIT